MTIDFDKAKSGLIHLNDEIDSVKKNAPSKEQKILMHIVSKEPTDIHVGALGFFKWIWLKIFGGLDDYKFEKVSNRLTPLFNTVFEKFDTMKQDEREKIIALADFYETQAAHYRERHKGQDFSFLNLQYPDLKSDLSQYQTISEKLSQGGKSTNALSAHLSALYKQVTNSKKELSPGQSIEKRVELSELLDGLGNVFEVFEELEDKRYPFLGELEEQGEIESILGDIQEGDLGGAKVAIDRARKLAGRNFIEEYDTKKIKVLQSIEDLYKSLPNSHFDTNLALSLEMDKLRRAPLPVLKGKEEKLAEISEKWKALVEEQEELLESYNEEIEKLEKVNNTAQIFARDQGLDEGKLLGGIRSFLTQLQAEQKEVKEAHKNLKLNEDTRICEAILSQADDILSFVEVTINQEKERVEQVVKSHEKVVTFLDTVFKDLKDNKPLSEDQETNITPQFQEFFKNREVSSSIKKCFWDLGKYLDGLSDPSKIFEKLQVIFKTDELLRDQFRQFLYLIENGGEMGPGIDKIVALGEAIGLHSLHMPKGTSSEPCFICSLGKESYTGGGPAGVEPVEVSLRLALSKLSESSKDVHPIYVGLDGVYEVKDINGLEVRLDALQKISKEFPHVTIIPGTIHWTISDGEGAAAGTLLPIFENGRLVSLRRGNLDPAIADRLRGRSPLKDFSNDSSESEVFSCENGSVVGVTLESTDGKAKQSVVGPFASSSIIFTSKEEPISDAPFVAHPTSFEVDGKKETKKDNSYYEASRTHLHEMPKATFYKVEDYYGSKSPDDLLTIDKICEKLGKDSKETFVRFLQNNPSRFLTNRLSEIEPPDVDNPQEFFSNIRDRYTFADEADYKRFLDVVRGNQDLGEYKEQFFRLLALSSGTPITVLTDLPEAPIETFLETGEKTDTNLPNSIELVYSYQEKKCYDFDIEQATKKSEIEKLVDKKLKEKNKVLSQLELKFIQGTWADGDDDDLEGLLEYRPDTILEEWCVESRIEPLINQKELFENVIVATDRIKEGKPEDAMVLLRACKAPQDILQPDLKRIVQPLKTCADLLVWGKQEGVKLKSLKVQDDDMVWDSGYFSNEISKESLPKVKTFLTDLLTNAESIKHFITPRKDELISALHQLKECLPGADKHICDDIVEKL